MTSMYDIEPNEMIEKLAAELKKLPELKAPEWAVYVKTGTNKERPPVRSDWWYIRAAAILRSIYVLGPIGVSKLRTKYGSKKRRGHQPPEFRKGSGNIIRKILQKLEKEGLIQYKKTGIHKGRKITGKGKSFVDKAAAQALKAKPRKAEQEEMPKAAAAADKGPANEEKQEKKAKETKEAKHHEGPKAAEAPEHKHKEKAQAPDKQKQQ